MAIDPNNNFDFRGEELNTKIQTNVDTTIPIGGGVLQNTPIPPRREVEIDAATDQAEQRKTGEDTTESSLPLDFQTADSIHRGELSPPGSFGDVASSNYGQAFGNAVNVAFNFFGIANQLRNSSRNQRPVEATDQFILTQSQIELLESKAREFASFGVVPYDVLEDFLYVLVSIDDFETLRYVATVINLTEIINPSFVRNVDDILRTPNLYLIGYIANGLAALTKQFASELSSTTAATDTDLSSFGQYSGASSPPIPSFGGLQDLVSIGTSAVALAQTVKGLTETFGEGSISDLLSQISTIPNVVTQLVSNITQVTSSVQKLTGINLGALDQQLAKLNQIVVAAKTLQRLSEQLRPISEMANADQMVADVREQLTNIQSRATDIQNRMTEVLGEIADAKPSENFREALEAFQNDGTNGFHLIREILGQVPPVQVLANNPLLKEPSGIGKLFFGERALFMNALDQTFARRVAIFGDPSSAVGTNSFGFQNFGSFSGPVPLQNAISSVIGGNIGGVLTQAVSIAGSSLVTNTLQKLVGDKANDVANILGVAANAAIELRRSDNAIPFMIGMVSALAGENKSPFSTNIFSKGWETASSVGNYLQQTNPEYLAACRTNL